MSERRSYAHGTPSWVDIMSADIETTRGFYTALFDWELGPEEAPEAGGYRQFMKDGKRVAASAPQSQDMIDSGMPTVWNTYMTVDSAAAVTALVEKSGGMVVAPPFEVFDAGSMAMFADPEGAMFSVWQPDKHIGAELVNEPGTICWNELASHDPAKASEFYADVLGWRTLSTETLRAR
ncbi:MAG: VOC family protein, partial [Acidimicrobiales bacterium]